MSEIDFTLIVITDSELVKPRSVIDVVAAALAGGARMIQLRNKHANARELLAEADALLQVVREHGAHLIVNDRVDVALMAGADGVHLGPDDLPVRAARRIAPPPFLIGYSTDQVEHALAAQAEGADYIGCGAVFGTSTKNTGDERIGPAQLDAVANAVTIPVVGIGGIEVTNIDQIGATWAAGAAVVRAVMAAAEPAVAVLALLDGFARGRSNRS